MSGSVHRYLVTADNPHKMTMWAQTGAYANWIEGRDNGDHETWLVTCFDDNAEDFLTTATRTGVTVQEIHGAGPTEAYSQLTGEPDSGWTTR